jgi:putative transposase
MYKQKKQYRLPGFNYASNDAYFVTIVCANRTHYFGTIKDQKIHYSEMGKIAIDQIKMAIEMKKNISIPEYVVMPNHVHIIVVLKNEEVSTVPISSPLPLGNGYVRSGRIHPLQKGSLGSFVNSYKGHVTRSCKAQKFIDFGWQSRFHDRVIRDEKEYNNIATYINENVFNWDEDDNNQ